jgi:methionyl-tRNA formyltransferase
MSSKQKHRTELQIARLKRDIAAAQNASEHHIRTLEHHQKQLEVVKSNINKRTLQKIASDERQVELQKQLTKLEKSITLTDEEYFKYFMETYTRKPTDTDTLLTTSKLFSAFYAVYENDLDKESTPDTFVTLEVFEEMLTSWPVLLKDNLIQNVCLIIPFQTE